ncbi:hydantoinase/oxoprolinase family protein [Burkholderia anthina]|nr:hydantoinase/oxoprolinase family protein [Burkholderia anthina]
MNTPALRVASDVGGTFTDNIAYDIASGSISVAKVSTTPQNRAIGTIEGLRRAIEAQGRSGSDVVYVGHGMTTATNAVIQRNGARTALVTNAGFRDLLLIGRQDRPSLYDIATVRPAPLVERELCFGVKGRLGPGGDEVEPLSLDDLTQVAETLKDQNIEAVAILFLHAYANPAHELQAKAFLEKYLPNTPICASTEVLKEFREFERGSTAVLNAYLRPLMEDYLQSLTHLVRASEGLGVGPDVPVMVIEASGGLMTVDSARERPVHTVLSGPAGGVVASAHVAASANIDNIITMDIGGTSTDISLLRERTPEITRNARLETVPIRVPVIDINAIGSGGGSIAWIDDGGALRVGPQSAEAVPGPAAYGRGGQRATVTDANVVLGRFGGDAALGGHLRLDVEAARQVIDRTVAQPLGLSITEAAAGILLVAHANIVRGIRVVSIERGHDPRSFALVPFGGAGPMHGTPVAHELGMRTMLIPPYPGILCAFGQLVANLRHDLIETRLFDLKTLDAQKFHGILDPLIEQANELLTADGVPPERRQFDLKLDMRYRGQSFELGVPLAWQEDGAIDGLRARFDATHRARFGHADPSAPVEVVAFCLTAVGHIDAPGLPKLRAGEKTPQASACRGTRQVFFERLDLQGPGSWHDTPIYVRDDLLAGNEIAGPAVIEEVSATTILYPGDLARVHESGSILVEVGV